MSSTTKQRISAQGWLTRAARALSDLVHENADKVALVEAIADFDKRIDTLDNIQQLIEVELDGDELLADIEKAADFRDVCRKQRTAAKRLLSDISTTIAGDADDFDCVSNHSASTQGCSREASLPKLELPTFSGDVTKWPSFWDQFTAVIDGSDLPEVSKFVYLLSLLTAEAKLSVKGLTISAAHYQIAKDIMVQRYGRKERIIFTHVQQLMNITVPGNITCENTVLWKLQDELLAHVRSLEALGVTGDQYGVILTPLILSRLPQDVRLEWAREGEGRESDLDWLLTFLASEINRRERSQSFRDTTTTHDPVVTTCEEKVRSARKASASALHVHSSTSGSEDVQVSCDVCGVKGHAAERCWNLTKLSTVSERRSKVQMCGLCFRCLRRDHVAKDCLNKCDKCGGRHHVLLCDPRPTSTEEKCSTISTSRRSDSHGPVSHSTEQKYTNSNLSLASNYNVHANSKDSKTKRVLLQTTDVTASGCTGKSGIFTLLFDTGSDRSYVSSRLVKRVEPEWVGTQPISYSAFGTYHGGKSELRNLFHVNLKCADDSYVSLFATEIPTICAPVYRPDIPLHVLQSFEQLSIEADCSDGGEVQVDVLIGLDSYWTFMKSGIVRNTGGLVAQESVFGWVLSGSLVDDGGSPSVVSHQLLCFNEVPEAALHKFWDLESIGISDAPVEAADVSAVFKQQVDRVDPVYRVGVHQVARVDPMDQVEQLVASEVWLKGPKFIRDRSGNMEITTGLAGVEQNVSSVVMLVLSLLVSMSSFTVSSVLMLVLSLLVSMSSFTVPVVMLVLSLLVSMSSFTVSVLMLVLSLLVSMSSFTVSVVMLVLSLLVSMSSFTVSVAMLVLSLLVTMGSFTVSVVMLVLSLLVSMSSFVLCGDACIVLVGLYEHPVTAKDLVARYKVRSQLVDHFWDLWSSDYIRNMPACQGDTERGHLSVGSVVLVREGCYSRMQWPIGVVTRVYPGRDGNIRAVEVRTAKGTYVRSIQLLHDLEITESTECDKETPLTVTDTDTDDSNHVFQSSESQYVTRYGRSVKPVKKLNL